MIMKKIKTMLGVALIGVAAYLFLRKPADVSSVPAPLSEQDKKSLFITALGYRGGIAPSKQMQEQYEVSSAAAKQKINDLNLTAEFEAYVKSLENQAKPS